MGNKDDKKIPEKGNQEEWNEFLDMFDGCIMPASDDALSHWDGNEFDEESLDLMLHRQREAEETASH